MDQEKSWQKALTAADVTAVQGALDEIEAEEVEYVHPMVALARARQAWDERFSSPTYRLAPPAWHVGLTRALLTPLTQVDTRFRRLVGTEVTAVIESVIRTITQEADTGVSPQPLDEAETIWAYETPYFRLIYHLDREQKRLTLLSAAGDAPPSDLSPAEQLKKRFGLT
jgi:hypothetical protein